MIECIPAPLKPTSVLIYEYGARLDAECAAAVHDQLHKAHQLYNTLVEIMQRTVGEIADLVLAASGDEAHALHRAIEAQEAAWKLAKASDDREQLKVIAQTRRDLRRQLWPLLAAARKQTKEQTKPLYARVGRSSACETYQARCRAVEAGLGWATANQTLEAALNAWQKTIKLGQAPRFAKASLKTQRSLTLQFTKAGGVPASDLLAGRHSEVVLQTPESARPRQYGQFQFRLGAASAHVWATGTWQYHRALPEGASIGLARLVMRRHADKARWALQFMVKLPDPVSDAVPEQRRPLVALHMGWASDVEGRRLAGLATGNDPGLGEILRLPKDVEHDLNRADEIQSLRDQARNDVMATLASLSEAANFPESVAEQVAALRRLPVEHVAPRRLYGLIHALTEAGLEDDPLCVALREWRREDRKVWQARESIAKRARNRRKNHYREVAKDLVTRFACVAVETVDLENAARKLSAETGEKTDFAKAARSGRFVASLYELEQAISWSCNRTGTPLIMASGDTIRVCPYCQGALAQSEADWHVLECAACGAHVDRKLAGASNVWHAVSGQLESLVTQFHEEQSNALEAAAMRQAEKVQKVSQARAHNRQREPEVPG